MNDSVSYFSFISLLDKYIIVILLKYRSLQVNRITFDCTVQLFPSPNTISCYSIESIEHYKINE